jgi:hypothetical protein
MIADCPLDNPFWEYAALYANYIRNRTPTTKQNIIPYQQMYNHPPQLKHCNKFGTTCYFINKLPKDKLQPRAIQAIFLGLTEDNNYLVLDPTTNYITTTRNIKFSNITYKLPKINDELYFNDDPSDPDFTLPNNQYKFNNNNQNKNNDTLDQEIEELIQALIQKENEEQQEDLSQLQESINFNQSESEDESYESTEEPEEIEDHNTTSSTIPTSSTTPIKETITQTSPIKLTQPNIRRSNRIIRNEKDPLYGTKDRNFIKQHWKLLTTTTDQQTQNTPHSKSLHQALISQVHNIDIQPNNPTTYHEAIQNPLWKESINKEINTLLNMNTWTFIPKHQIPTKANIIGSRYVFKIKSDGTYKTRIVAKGYQQTNSPTNSSPVISHETLMLILSLAQSNQLDIHQLDVDAAFLNANLSTDIFMQLPPGFENAESQYVKLNKSIYGLKEASSLWFNKFTNILKQFEFYPTISDPCLFIKREKDFDPNNLDNNIESTTNLNNTTLIGIHVDDCILIGTQENIKKLKDHIKKFINIKDFGQATKILGMEINRTPQKITLTQKQLINETLIDLKLDSSKRYQTPMIPINKTNTTIEDEQPFTNKTLYQQATGSLMYLSKKTRPDISYVANYLSRQIQPQQKHWKIIKRTFRYLKGTIDYGINFYTTPTKLTAYSDASYADDTNRNSTTGFILMLNNGPIAWSTKKQPIIALSSTEAEYIALTQTKKK